MDLDLGLNFDCPNADDLTNPHMPKHDVWCFDCKKTMKQSKAHNVRTVHGIVFKCKACATPVETAPKFDPVVWNILFAEER